MSFTRDIIDETIANGFSNKTYKAQYEFYFHILAQCKVILSTDIETAGVTFSKTKYILIINPEFFNPLPLVQRLGILKHEMLHILFNHVGRRGDREHKPYNCACDCSINQQIERSHLTEGAIYPDVLEKEVKKMGLNTKFPLNENAETYYDLLPEEDKGDSKGKDKGDFYDGLQEKNPLDNHESWDDSEGDEELKRELTKRMIEKGMEKSRGNTPSNISQLLDIWTRKPQVSWKKVLRNIASNKKVKKVSTIMKKSRRFPKRPEIRGHKKDRTWDLICILDVSGSMSNDEIVFGLTEINEVCKITNSNMKILQVDTECSEIEEYDLKKKEFKRNKVGGTYIAAGVEYILQNKIKADGIICISDMYIEDIPSDKYWNRYKNPVIFLSTSGKIPNLLPNHKIFNLYDV